MTGTFDTSRYNSTNLTLSNGNLTVTASATAATSIAMTTAQLTSGKYYWEFNGSFSETSSYGFDTDGALGNTDRMGITNPSSGYNFALLNNFALDFKDNDYDEVTELPEEEWGSVVLQVAVDIDNGKIWYGIDNVWGDEGNPATGANPVRTDTDLQAAGYITPGISLAETGDYATICGTAEDCAYTAPSGFSYLDLSDGPTIGTCSHSDLTMAGAALSGSISDMGGGTTYDASFEWGEDTEYGNETATQEITETSAITANLGDVIVGEAYTALDPATTYHYRLKVTDGVDIWYSDDAEFETYLGKIYVNGTWKYFESGKIWKSVSGIWTPVTSITETGGGWIFNTE